LSSDSARRSIEASRSDRRSVLESLDVLAAFFGLRLLFLLLPKNLILRLEQGFLLHGLGLLSRIAYEAVRLIGRANRAVLDHETVDGIAEGGANEQSNEQERDCAGHAPSFRW